MKIILRGSLIALGRIVSNPFSYFIEKDDPSYEGANNQKAKKNRNGKAVDPRNNDYRSQGKGRK